ncbi:Tat pathway signal sequence domain protein [Streptomyces gibsoniae]|uniref:Tat pathway signal sequence domain protein n=1 Tax=Streptomyces gibsoniae TaxID=3075529 RepID=A0ABU2U658_9ACTN|nr:Tat pathway signal sequence domain protein [Streptomyces sp. DSM 41699]MDT0468713.1 Tat pathway signal sequence domain protein [Streptomyces sp. DSM 41699]
MRRTVRRHLGKVVAGTAIAVTGTAVMVGITLPGSVSAEESGGRGGAVAARQDGGQGQRAVAPGVVEQAPAEGAKGTGGDPLTDDEIKRVETIALTRQQFTAGEDVEGRKGLQRLSVDVAEPDPDQLDDPHAPRRADVTFYDYKDDGVISKTVNLDTGKVERTGTRHGVQPPLGPEENAEAAKLLIADPLGAGLRADYKDATGKDLTSPDQLTLTSIVYRAVPGAQPSVLDQCGRHRCVRLFPKIPNGAWIDSRSFVVDLSARKVGRLA